MKKLILGVCLLVGLLLSVRLILPGLFLPTMMTEVDKLAASAPEPRQPVVTNLPYRHRMLGRNLHLDIYQPYEKAASPGSPVIVFLHGGSWLQGDKDMIRIIHRFLDKLRSAGYAVVAINYTDSLLRGLAGPVENSMQALGWIRDHGAEYGLDPQRLGLYGVSAGAHLALMNVPGILADPGMGLRFLMIEYGPTDLVAMARGEAFEYSRSLRLLPSAVLAKYSPVRLVDSNWPPVLIFHGDADRIVDVRQSQRLADALKARGVPFQLNIIPGGDHAFFNQSQEVWKRMEDQSLEFIKNHFD